MLSKTPEQRTPFPRRRCRGTTDSPMLEQHTGPPKAPTASVDNTVLHTWSCWRAGACGRSTVEPGLEPVPANSFDPTSNQLRAEDLRVKEAPLSTLTRVEYLTPGPPTCNQNTNSQHRESECFSRRSRYPSASTPTEAPCRQFVTHQKPRTLRFGSKGTALMCQGIEARSF